MTPPATEEKEEERFDSHAISWFGLVLLLVFGSVAAWFPEVFETAGLFEEGDDAMQHVAAYTLFVLGLLCVLAGVWFALIEARKPATPEAVVSAESAGQGLSTVVSTLRGNKISTILFSVGFVLLAAAAAGSGIVDLSIGENSSGSSLAE